MVIRLAWLVVFLAGCYRDRYTCERDSQCDVEGGRCEIDELCTGFDESCPTKRSYQHAGDQTGLCFDDAVVPINLCAGGQSAAKREGPCLEAVCARLPMCCDIAWTDACVQLAQQEQTCELRCDTRIAIGATKGTTELWDLRWVGDRFEIPTKVTELTTLLQWVAPAPGELEPRLAGVHGNKILVGAHELPFDGSRDYQTISTIPFSRDGRDTIAVSSKCDAMSPCDVEFTLEIFEPAIEEHRTFVVPGGVALSWGDIDHNDDAFIDAVVRKGGQASNQYSYLLNLDGDDHLRQLVDKAVGVLGGGPTQGGVGVRQTDWLDLDGDANLDLAVFGSQVALHHNATGLRDVPEELIDCSPPVVGGCAAADEPDFEGASFAGCALPDPTKPSVVFATFPDRKLFRSDGQAPTQITFPGDACACVRMCDPDPCTATDCTCKYNCEACVPILAVIARDLDGDHQLDLIAIDASLTVFHAFGPDFVWSDPTPIPTSLTGNVIQVFTSTSGAPL